MIVRAIEIQQPTWVGFIVLSDPRLSAIV